MKAFSAAISSGSLGALTHLVLDSNQIGDAGMIEFSRSIANGSMGPLRRLYLRSNQIGDAGMISLSEAIGKGSMANLVHLNLFKNQQVVSLDADREVVASSSSFVDRHPTT